MAEQTNTPTKSPKGEDKSPRELTAEQSTVGSQSATVGVLAESAPEGSTEITDLKQNLIKSRKKLFRRANGKDLRGRHPKHCKCGNCTPNWTPRQTNPKTEETLAPTGTSPLQGSAGEAASADAQSAAPSFSLPEPDVAEIQVVGSFIHVPFEIFASKMGVKDYKLAEEKRIGLAKGALQLFEIWVPGITKNMDPRWTFTLGVGFAFASELFSIYKMKPQRDVTPSPTENSSTQKNQSSPHSPTENIRSTVQPSTLDPFDRLTEQAVV